MNARISKLEISLFFRQLATLMQADIPIIHSLTILLESKNNHKSLQILIAAISHDIATGHTLAQCFHKFPRHFDPLSCHLISIGEQSGTLITMLQRIALHKEKMLAIKNKIKHALFYPGVILFVSLVTSMIMLVVVIPRFAELFQSMHSTLPAFTLGVIYLSQLLRHWFGLFLLPVFLIPFFFYYFKHSKSNPKLNPVLNSIIKSLVLKTPYFSQIYTKIMLARFSRSLATTVAAGIPISESLPIIAHTTGSGIYSTAILKLRAQITKGQQLHQAMRKNTLFSSLLVQMVKMGEESGTLEKMLEKVADMYEIEFDQWISTMGSLTEPLIIVILGVLIGGIVIAMYLPIFRLGNIL